MKNFIKIKYPLIHKAFQKLNDVRLRSKNRLIATISNIYEYFVNTTTHLVEIETKTGWSFVIITAGTQNDILKQSLDSIRKEMGGSLFEIILVGPPHMLKEEYAYDVKFIPYRELYIGPGLITKKKNMGVALAIYDKVVVTHDYIALTPGWKKGFDEFGSNFDVCMTRVVNENGIRWKDWLTLDYPGVSFAFLPYDVEMTKYQYISGTYFVVKRNFYAKYPLNEKLRWSDGEDGEWSLRVRKVTTFRMNTQSTVNLLKYKPLPDMLIPNGYKITNALCKS
jgi:hypothetical protein